MRINGLNYKKYIDWEKIEKEAPQCVVSFLMFYHSPFYFCVAISSQFFAILKNLALKINVMINAYRLLDKLKLNINFQTKFSRYRFSIFRAKSSKSMIQKQQHNKKRCLRVWFMEEIIFLSLV